MMGTACSALEMRVANAIVHGARLQEGLEPNGHLRCRRHAACSRLKWWTRREIASLQDAWEGRRDRVGRGAAASLGVWTGHIGMCQLFVWKTFQ